MHIESYQIDGKLLRTSAANFSASGLKHQNNEFIVTERTEAATAFKRAFDARLAGVRSSIGCREVVSICSSE
jgi:hypothetical protein